ncbi:MAG TPA: hypothetical protein VFJ47_07005, partial [Terriglobales bacterium]|nr:hypothetical protein [Terriglobales bacterium]
SDDGKSLPEEAFLMKENGTAAAAAVPENSSSSFSAYCTTYFPFCFLVQVLHVVLLAPVLPDLRHDFLFVPAMHFPSAALDHIFALETYFTFIKCHDFLLIKTGIHLISRDIYTLSIDKYSSESELNIQRRL